MKEFMKVIFIIIVSLVTSYAANEYFHGNIEVPQSIAATKSIEIRNIEAQETVAKYTINTFIINCISLIVSITGILFVVKTLTLNKEAIDAAEKSIHITKSGNILSNRAWLSIESKLVKVYRSKTHMGVEGVYFEIFYTIKNHGNTPASNVNVHFESDMYLGSPLIQLTDHINNVRKHSINPGNTVYPGQSIHGRFMTFISDEKLSNQPIHNEIKFISPASCGCVFYNIHGESEMKNTGVFYLLSVYENDNVLAIMEKDGEDDWVNKNIQLIGPMVAITE